MRKRSCSNWFNWMLQDVSGDEVTLHIYLFDGGDLFDTVGADRLCIGMILDELMSIPH